MSDSRALVSLSLAKPYVARFCRAIVARGRIWVVCSTTVGSPAAHPGGRSQGVSALASTTSQSYSLPGRRSGRAIAAEVLPSGSGYRRPYGGPHVSLVRAC